MISSVSLVRAGSGGLYRIAGVSRTVWRDGLKVRLKLRRNHDVTRLIDGTLKFRVRARKPQFVLKLEKERGNPFTLARAL